MVMDVKDVEKSISEVYRETLGSKRCNFVQYVHLTRADYNKLKLLAFVENQSRAAISRNAIVVALQEYEAQNGRIVELAEEAVQDDFR